MPRVRRLLLLSALVPLVIGCSRSWEAEHSLEIAAGASTVWQLLTELERYPEWNPYSRRVDGKLAVGEVVRVEAHLHNEVRSVDNLVTQIEVERTLCWKSLNWYRFLVQGTRCRYLEPLPRGRVRLRHHEVMAGPMAGLVERLYGLHLPHTATVFEALVLAVLGQQISTSVARITRTLLIETFGPSG